MPYAFWPLCIFVSDILGCADTFLLWLSPSELFFTDCVEILAGCTFALFFGSSKICPHHIQNFEPSLFSFPQCLHIICISSSSIAFLLCSCSAFRSFFLNRYMFFCSIRTIAYAPDTKRKMSFCIRNFCTIYRLSNSQKDVFFYWNKYNSK